MRKYYLLVAAFPLVLLSACSYLPSLTSTQALDILEGIEYHQALSSFSFPNAFSIIIKEKMNKDETNLSNNGNVSTNLVKTITYSKDNNFFSYIVNDLLDEDNNSEYYFYSEGLTIFEAVKNSKESYYRSYDSYTFSEIKEAIRQKAVSIDAFNILLGVKEVNDLGDIFYNNIIGRDAYQNLLDDDTTLNVFNHVFVSPDINSLKVKEDIVYTYDNDEGDYNIYTKTSKNRDIQFEENLMMSDYQNEEVNYKYMKENQVIRTYNYTKTTSIEVDKQANITPVNLANFTKK